MDTIKSIMTYQASIYIAGNYDDAVRACKRFCKIGLCVTVEKCHFVYTGGEELGVKVGLVQYPKFPKNHLEIFGMAEDLALFLRKELFQDSVLIVASDGTKWITSR